MIRKCQLLFCDNDHGTGDVTFPDLDALDAYGTKQLFIDGSDVKSLRKAAKQEGWGRVNGADYCPGCMESGI
jgi:hypothetical protein